MSMMSFLSRSLYSNSKSRCLLCICNKSFSNAPYYMNELTAGKQLRRACSSTVSSQMLQKSSHDSQSWKRKHFMKNAEFLKYHTRLISDNCRILEDATEQQDLQISCSETEDKETIKCDVLDITSVESAMESLRPSLQVTGKKKWTIFDPPPNLEMLDDFAPELSPSYNMAAYVNKSPTLQELVRLGVNLSKYDEDLHKARYVLSLKFEEDIKPHLLFLHDLGVAADKWGRMLTVNPFLLKEDLQTLHTRVDYLASKNFSQEAIANIVSSYPKWLTTSVVKVDSKLGFFQKTFKLSGDEIRTITTNLPRIMFHEPMKIKRIQFILVEEYGFNRRQVRELVVANPKIFLTSYHHVRTRLKILVTRMQLSYDDLVKLPRTLTANIDLLDNRHYFLVSLGRAQYDPTKANYINPETLVDVSDAEFAVNMARSSVHAFNMFLMTL
uniref:Transcription termination factor 3 n=1 Tax=Hirondellea gigas TaxID=1518452 RepID=A0A2P2I5M0_9CRUS